MAQEARFLACLCDTGKPGEYRLILCCFSCELKNSVQELLSSKFRVCCLGEENSLKPLCREDQVFVSLSEAFTVLQKEQFENFFSEVSVRYQDLTFTFKFLPSVVLLFQTVQTLMICS